MWAIADIADAVEAGLRHRAEQLDLEQSVYGLDVQDELTLHPVLAQGFHHAGFGVHREQRYPGDRHRRNVTEGERCDFVLTRDDRPLIHPDAQATLFDPAPAPGRGGGVPLDEAFWLEVKVVSQFTIEGPNANYSSQLLSTVRQDVTKLSKDPGILHAGLLIVLFVRDQRTADHDLKIWQDRCLQRGLPIGSPSLRFVGIAERHGHGVCAAAVYPVRHL